MKVAIALLMLSLPAAADEKAPQAPSKEARDAVKALVAKGAAITIDGEYRVKSVRFTAATATDDDLAQLKAFPNVQSVTLYGGNFTDAALQHLAGLKQLRTLALRGNFTNEKVAQLRESLPNLQSIRTVSSGRTFGTRPDSTRPQGSRFGRSRFGGRGSRPTGLLAFLIRSGQNELELNAEQRSQLAEIERQAPDVRNAMRAAFDKYRTANNSVDRDKLREELSRISSEARKKEQDQIRKVLTEEKFARAQQLYWQSLGSRALTMREFVEELKITPNQRNQMSEISRSFSRSRFPSSPDTRPTREDAARIAAEREKKMLEVLTDEQRAALKKKLGAPAKKE